jgi:hypothetical protein
MRDFFFGGWRGWVAAWGLSGLAALGQATEPMAADSTPAGNVTTAASAKGATPAKRPGAGLVVLESQFFEVAGPDYASTQTVMQMTRRLQADLGRYFTWPDMQVRAIQVQLVPVAQADFSAPFVVLAEKDGHRIALVRWSADTKFRDVCLAMSSAALEQLVQWGDGLAAAKQVPDWLKIAFGLELETSLKPGAQDILAEQAGRLPVLTLRQIMTARGPYGDALPTLEVNAYWLARFLQAETGGEGGTRTLYRALAAGQAPSDVLRAQFPGRFAQPEDLDLWWAVGYRELVAGRAPPVQTMAETRALLDDLQAIVVEAAGHDTRIGLEAAWPVHATPRAKAALQMQLDEARARLPWANPVYYNALWSLAACLETLMKNDEGKYEAAWKRYTDDRARAEATEYQVVGALGAGETGG